MIGLPKRIEDRRLFVLWNTNTIIRHFDQNILIHIIKAKLRKAERAYMRAANIVAQKAIEIRSEARSAYEAYRGRHDIARHYRKAVVPLHRVIEQQALLTNNGMITNTFELLADVRAKLNADLQSDRAKQDFWLADASLDAALYGAGPDMEEGEEEEFEIAEAEGGDE